MAGSPQSLRIFRSKNQNWRDGSHDPSLNARRGAKISWGVLDDSPVIVNWSGLDPSPEQAEITPTLEAVDNWIILTHPLGPEKSATPHQEIMLTYKRR